MLASEPYVTKVNAFCNVGELLLQGSNSNKYNHDMINSAGKRLGNVAVSILWKLFLASCALASLFRKVL